jgi:thiamine biosynthesis lipoprotein
MTGPVATPATWRFERRAMGSPFRLTMTGVDAATAEAAWATASRHAEELEEALSRFRPTSDLTALNRRAGDPEPAPVSRPLARALAAAASAHRRTGGAFDPRVLADLEALGYRGTDLATLPSPRGATSDTPISRPAFADGRWLHLEPRDSRAAVAGPVDLGGIGKGLSLRWIFGRITGLLGLLDSAGGALLEAGGDLVAAGPAPQGGPWLVGIEDPAGGEERAVVAVSGGAVATSSTRVHAWRTADGRAVHHLLDPRTGEPGGAGLAAVTVAGPDPTWAEVWSKALFLEGRRGIGARARALGLAAWWIADDGDLEMTAAARLRTAWVAGEG